MPLRYSFGALIMFALVSAGAQSEPQNGAPHKSAPSPQAAQGDDPYAQLNQCITDANTEMNKCVDSGKSTLLVCKPAEQAQLQECEKKFDHPPKSGDGSS